jgi:hypothetical protein
MLKQAALEFGRSLADLRLMAIVAAVNRPLSAERIHEIKIGLQDTLGNLKRIAILSDLDDAIGPELDRFQAALQVETLAQLSSRADHLQHRVQDELHLEWYLQVDRDEVRFYDKPSLFGEKVAAKFPKAIEDIKNAGNCIALQQPTACVFHLMRAMEIAVRRLSQRLGVTITPQTTWRQMTGNMDTKVKALPDTTEAQKDKKNDWEAARANLHQVGSVWRNNTMHPAASYSRPQAREIFDACRVFMTALCDL